MEREAADFASLLPDDVLADALRRVAPRGLAASRCVCRAWRALIDGRGMLRADLLPRSLAGLVISYGNLRFARLFARPNPAAGGFECDGMPDGAVLDHCNGLLLLYNWVYNPATGRYATLPERPATAAPRAGMERVVGHDAFLAFDPAVSPHYEVFLIPSVLDRKIVERLGGGSALSQCSESEWPPSPCALSVFSSATGVWEERSFRRQGEAAGTVADAQLDQRLTFQPYRHAEYWKGVLYVHCQTDFVMRISPSNSTYRVIKPPMRGPDEVSKDREFHLGRSEKGIYYASLDDNYCLRVWILDESCDQIEWKLRHTSGRGLAFPNLSSDHGPWVLSCVYSESDDDESEEDEEARVEEEEDDDDVEEEFEWNSDDDNALPIDDVVEKCDAFIQILAFHPFKEIVFLDRSSRGLAYHLSSSKLEELGNLLPANFHFFQAHVYMGSSFPYTPSWMGELPRTFE